MFKFESEQALKKIKEAGHRIIEEPDQLNEFMNRTQEIP